MTAGWPVNDGSEETNPTTLTMRVMRSRSPMTLLTAARAFTAHTAAYFWASSGDTVGSSAYPSVPADTLPVASSLPLMNGSWPEVYTWLPETMAGTLDATGAATSGSVMPS